MKDAKRWKNFYNHGWAQFIVKWLIAKINLQIQHDPQNIPLIFFTILGKNHPKIHVKVEMTQTRNTIRAQNPRH